MTLLDLFNNNVTTYDSIYNWIEVIRPYSTFPNISRCFQLIQQILTIPDLSYNSQGRYPSFSNLPEQFMTLFDLSSNIMTITDLIYSWQDVIRPNRN